MRKTTDPLPTFGGQKSSGFVGKVDPRDVQKIQSIMQALSVKEEDCHAGNNQDPAEEASSYPDLPSTQPR